MTTETPYHYWLIELLHWWEGEVQPLRLMECLHCTRQHASSKLREYRTSYPTALDYCTKDKVYRPAAGFKPGLISGQADEYLGWLSGHSQGHAGSLPVQVLQTPTRTITPQIIRPLIRALRENLRIEVDYGSVTSAERHGRIIVPHQLIKTANRWHIRAWCEKSRDFRDFVLSRFYGEPELLDKSSLNPEEDEGWNTQIELVLAPDHRLSKEKQAVIEQDYGMTNGQLRYATRACLVNYLLQSLNIDAHKLESQAEAQQLVIVNISDIKPWLFG